MTNAAANDTIQVGAGTFTGSAQVVINKNLTLRGEGTDQTTLMPGFDTASSGNGRGWFLVSSGVFRVHDLTLDGNEGTDQVAQAIRVPGPSGTVLVDSVDFTNIRFANYNGAGIASLTGTYVRVSNSTFTNIERIGVNSFGAGDFVDNTYVGKGDGDHIDYALDIGGGGTWNISGSTVSGNTGVASTDGSSSAGFLVTNFFPGATAASIDGNSITGNTTGIFVGFDNTDTSTVDANFNQIAGNESGVFSSNPDVDAQNNWWGCNAGPGDPACDPAEVDGGATGTVDADPWLVLGVSANPTTINAGGQTSQITASVAQNSDGATPGGNVFPSGVNVAFATTLGSIPSPVPTASPTAVSTLTSGAAGGTATVTATLDAQSVNTPVTITPLPVATPPSGGALGQVQPGTTKKKCKKGRKLKKGKCVKKKRKKK